jgi:hypothetical protein
MSDTETISLKQYLFAIAHALVPCGDRFLADNWSDSALQILGKSYEAIFFCSCLNKIDPQALSTWKK